MMILRCLVGFAVPAGTLTACMAACMAATAPGHEIAFTFSTRQPIVQVRVNGGAPLPFVVDTGASIHVVDEDVARAAGLALGAAGRMSGGGEAGFESRLADTVRFESGGAVWEGQRAVVTRLGYPAIRHYAGLLGAPILTRYVVQFDYQANKLRLLAPAGYTPAPGATVVPFELQEDLPIVRATVDAGAGPIEARLMVDTGASQFVDLNRPFVDDHRLLEAVPDAARVERPGLGGTAPVLYGTGRSVVLGGLTFERPRLGFSRAQSGSSSRRERDGIIGNDLLRQFRVTFDYARRRMVLEKPR